MRLLVGSAKHSPGATTLSVALACVLSEDRDDGPPVLIEGDPAGGDLAALLGLPSEVGLSTLAAAARHGHEPGLLWQHAHPLPAGGAVVLAPTDPMQCRSALAALGSRLDAIIDHESVDGVIDIGRVTDGVIAGSPTRCDALVLACRPDLAGIEHTRRLVTRVQAQELATSVAVVTIGDRPYGPSDVRSAMPSVIATTVPVDGSGAVSLLSGPARRARRSTLARSVRTVLDDVLGVSR